MTPSPRRKKAILFATTLLVSAAGFLLHAEPAAAGATQTILSKLGDITAGLVWVYGVLYFLYAAARALLAIASILLNFIYGITIITLPANLVVVQQGWTILRDIVNGLFILIIIWIAFTLIFNLENLGGKKLLVRVIVIGLLLNFSLTMVTAVFGFTNQLARPFAQPLGLDPYVKSDNETVQKNGIAGYIITMSGIHTVDQIVNKTVVDDLKTQADQQQKQIQQQQPTGNGEGPTQQWFAGVWESLKPSQIIPTAQADVGTFLTGGLAAACIGTVGIVAGSAATPIVGAAAATKASIPCIWGAGVVTELLSHLFGFKGPVEEVIDIAVNLAVSDVFIGLTAIAMLAAAILLAMRIIAMIFISVFAPVAFAAYMMPARYGEKLWNMWLDNLFRWAFVAPIFYFLLYLSLLMLQVAAATRAGVSSIALIPFQGNLFYIFSLIIFLVFLWASIFLTRKAAGMGAEAALSLGKKIGGFGLGLATGGLAFGAAAAARRATPRLRKILGSTVLRQTTLARRTGAYLERQGTRPAPHEKELEGFSDDYLVQEYDRSFRAERKVAIATLLAKRGELGKLGKNQTTGALDLAAQFGPASALSILKARPDLTNKELLAKIGMTKNTDGTDITTPEQAFAAVIKKIGTNEASNISTEVFKNDGKGNYEHKEAIEALWKEFRPEHLRQIATNKPALASSMMGYLDAKPELLKEIKPEMYTYLSSNTSQGLGLRLPAVHEKPQTILEQDIQAIAAEVVTEQGRYADQKSRMDRFTAMGRTTEADRARVDMEVLGDKIDGLNRKIDAMEEDLRESKVNVLSLQSTISNLPVAQEGSPYDSGVLPSGGTGKYKIDVLEGGPLPRGLNPDEKNGKIIGTPSSSAVGKHRLVIRITDQGTGAQSVPRPIVLEIKPKS